MTLPSQNGGVQPTDQQSQPTADAFPSSPLPLGIACNPKLTYICQCGLETDMRCARCSRPICDLDERRCAWHYCPEPDPHHTRTLRLHGRRRKP